MNPFAKIALVTTARDASCVALAGIILMIAFSYDPPLALHIGAHIALLYSIVLLARVFLLSEERIVQSEPWLVLEPEERPVGDTAPQWACERLKEVLLRFAKAASGTASVLFGVSLIASLN